MIWDEDISFEGYSKKKSEWFNSPDHFLGDPPISAQYALDLIYQVKNQNIYKQDKIS